MKIEGSAEELISLYNLVKKSETTTVKERGNRVIAMLIINDAIQDSIFEDVKL